MARYKPQETHSLLLPVVLSEQIEPGSFAFALSYLVDHELDFTGMDAQFKNDEVGASVYDPRVMCQRLRDCPRRVRAFQSADVEGRRACRDDDHGVAGDSGCGVQPVRGRCARAALATVECAVWGRIPSSKRSFATASEALRLLEAAQDKAQSGLSGAWKISFPLAQQPHNRFSPTRFICRRRVPCFESACACDR